MDLFTPDVIVAMLAAVVVAGYISYRYWDLHRWDVDPIRGMPNPYNPDNWIVGPIQYGQRVSTGLPLHPVAAENGRWAIDIPYPTPAAGHVHYVTMQCPPLKGKKRIRMVYRVEADPGVRIMPLSDPSAMANICLYFEKRNLRWEEKYEADRWFAKFSMHIPITPGEHVLHVMTAELDGPWSAASVSTRDSNPQAFEAALVDTGRVGFVLGGGTGLGHGVFATGPARITVLEFTIE